MQQRVEGEIRVGEANAACRVVARRLALGWWVLPLMLAMGVVLGLTGCGLEAILRAFVKLPPLPLGLILALGLYLWPVLPAYRGMINARYKRKLADRGVSGPLPSSWEITEEGFVYRIAGMEKTARWDAISEVFQTKGWWVLIAQGEGFYLPRRLFPAPAAERDFIASVLARLTEPAAKRSRAAAVFAGAGEG